MPLAREVPATTIQSTSLHLPACTNHLHIDEPRAVETEVFMERDDATYQDCIGICPTQETLMQLDKAARDGDAVRQDIGAWGRYRRDVRAESGQAMRPMRIAQRQQRRPLPPRL